MPGERYYGVYRGIITSATDPLNQGRAQVTMPNLGTGSSWAPLCRDPGASRTPPPIGAACYVAFENGDPNYPVIVGITG